MHNNALRVAGLLRYLESPHRYDIGCDEWQYRMGTLGLDVARIGFPFGTYSYVCEGANSPHRMMMPDLGALVEFLRDHGALTENEALLLLTGLTLELV